MLAIPCPTYRVTMYGTKMHMRLTSPQDPLIIPLHKIFEELACMQIAAVVGERELRLRQAMRTMGLLDSAYWMSWVAIEVASSPQILTSTSHCYCPIASHMTTLRPKSSCNEETDASPSIWELLVSNGP